MIRNNWLMQTTFVDMLIEETHEVAWDATATERPVRYTGLFHVA